MRLQDERTNPADQQTRISRLVFTLPVPYDRIIRHSGGMAEWLMAPVLKTGLVKANVGSNPSPSACRKWRRQAESTPCTRVGSRGGAGVAERDRLLSDCRGECLDRGFESPPPRCNLCKFPFRYDNFHFNLNT